MTTYQDERRAAGSAVTVSKQLPVRGALSTAVVLTAVVFLWLLAAPARATTSDDQARLTEFPVIVDTNPKTAPATDGGTVVWAESTADGWGIYAVCLDKVGDGQITLDDATLVAPVDSQPSHLAVCDDAVAWQLGDGASGSVWLGDACGGDPLCVSEQGVEPALADGVIVWVDFLHDAAGDIVAATTADPGTVVPVCADVGAQRSPSVSRRLVAWQDMRNGNWDVYAAKLDGSGWMGGQDRRVAGRCEGPVLNPSAEFPICTAEGDQTEPSVWGGVVAWTDGRDSAKQIWVAWAAACAGRWRMAPGASCERPAWKRRSFAVTTAAGDQVHPALGRGVVYWQDASAGAGKSDILGYTLADGQRFVVSDAAGAQTAPSAGRDSVVWLDGRAGPAGDVYAADLSSPGGAQPGAPKWISQKVLTLFLAAFQQLGVFTEVCYSTDGGQTFSDWQAMADVAEVPLPGEGVYAVALKFKDADGKEYGPIRFTVRVDRHAPCASALGATAVRRRHTAWLKFRVRDNMSPSASVTIVVRDVRGLAVKRLSVSSAAVGKRQVAGFVCTLPRGVYHYSVTARDLAGNTQKRAGQGRLIVR